MSGRYLEDFAVGQTFGSGRLRISGEQIKASRRSACGGDRRVLNGIFWVLRSYQIPLADEKSKPKSRRLTRSPLVRLPLA